MERWSDCYICGKPVKSGKRGPIRTFHKGSCKYERYQTKKVHVFECEECCTPIVASGPGHRRKFCSRVCTTRSWSRRKRHPDMPPLGAVARRWGFCCGICGWPVDCQLRSDDPWGPQIDHIIPVSRGGLNDPDNLQLTHKTCNGMKNDRPDGRYFYVVHELADILYARATA